MNVKQLIKELSKYPPNIRVVLAAGDVGYNDIILVNDGALKLNANRIRGELGKHDEARVNQILDENAVRIT